MSEPASELTIDDISDAFVECRTYKHAWRRLKDSGKAIKGDAILELKCMRCTTIRTDTFSITTGELWGRKYKYPDNYKLSEVVNVTQLRMELASRYHFIGGRKSSTR